jgi:hypothetical protein
MAVLLGSSQVFAEDALQETPIKPGYWTWPREKNMTPQAIAESCRTRVSVQLADGHYLTVKLRDADKAVAPPQVSEIGSCKFNRETQTEACSLRVTYADGTATAGLIESHFSFDADGVLKMTVTPTVDGKQGKSFDVYPVRCPEDIVWKALNGE